MALTQPTSTHSARAPTGAFAWFNAVPLLTVYLALLVFVPAVWVLPGLGAAAPPASLFGIGLLALWFGRVVGTFLPDQYVLLDRSYLGRAVSIRYVGVASWALLLPVPLVFARRVLRSDPSNRVRHLAAALAATIAAGVVTGATYDQEAFPTALGYLTLAVGLTAALVTIPSAADGVSGPTPRGVMRVAYRSESGPWRWWRRFDPEWSERGARS